MNRRSTLTLTTMALLCLGVAVPAGHVFAQQKSLKDQLAGAWTVVSNEQTDPDGNKHQLFGRIPTASSCSIPAGNTSKSFCARGVRVLKANSRIKGTPEENTAAVLGTTATFGTWSVDEGSKTIIVRITGSMYPNQEGTETKRTVSVSGDELNGNPATWPAACRSPTKSFPCKR